MKKFLFILLFINIQICPQIEVPKIKMWATDLTETLTETELDYLNERLKNFEDSTSNQVVFLMIPELNDYPIEEVAYEIFTKNKIGTRKNDNGVLLLIAKNDRKLRIEVGYGLEPVLTDALCSSIIRNTIVPLLKQEKYFEAVKEGIEAIFLVIGGEYIAEKDYSDESPISAVFIIILLIFLVLIFRKSGFSGGVYRTRGYGGWSGGGSNWGGGGGFSGGGGSSGGGGASGSW